MAIVVAHNDVKGARKGHAGEDGKVVWRTDFMIPAPGEVAQPQAFLAEESPGRHLRTHYHDNDEFQVFVSGSGTSGRHAIAPLQVHFARRHTPYGPIIASDQGCAFFTLRNRHDGGAKFLPESRQQLDGVPHRQPWQINVGVEFPPATDVASMIPIEGIKDEHGLDAQAIRLGSRAKLVAPDASNTGGQYLLILRGSLIHQGKEYRATTIVFVGPSEHHFQLEAGMDGLEGLALSFPRIDAPGTAVHSDAAAGFKVWQCALCAFVYDEAAGLPEECVTPGTRWSDVPETFGCPDCSASKADFRMTEL